MAIRVPISAGPLAGLDALLAIVQMPAGVPVATVAIDGAANAALLAVQILATADQGLARQLDKYKQDLAASLVQKQARLDEETGKLQKA